MSKPNAEPQPAPTRSARRWVLVAAFALVGALVLAAGGWLTLRALDDDPWVADASDTVDVCSLVRTADLEPFLVLDERSDLNPSLTMTDRRLTYLHDADNYADECLYRPAAESMVNVILTVGPAMQDQPPPVYEHAESEVISDIQGESRYYIPNYNSDGVTLTHINGAQVELRFQIYGSAPEVDLAQSRELLVPLTRTVIDRLPDSYVMPDDLTKGPCRHLVPESGRIFDSGPTYSRELVPESRPGLGRSFDCQFAHGSQRLHVHVETATPAIEDRIAVLRERDDLTPLEVNGTTVYQDSLNRHYVIDRDGRSLAFVRWLPAGEGNADPPEGDILEHITELAEAALGKKMVGVG